MTSRLKNQNGFTLVEALVSVALLGILASAASTMLSITAQQMGTNKSDKTEQKVVSSLIESIRADPNRFTKNYSPPSVDDKPLLTAAGSFPIAWSDHYYGKVAGCPTCYGRMAYFIRPHASKPSMIITAGLYEVTIFTIDLRKAVLTPDAVTGDVPIADEVANATMYKFLVTVR